MTEDWQKKLQHLSKEAKAQTLKKQAVQRIEQQKIKASQEINFSKEMSEVKPLTSSNRHSFKANKPKPKPLPIRQEQDTSAFQFIPNIDDSYDLSEPPAQYFRGGQGKKDINRLLNGQIRLVSTLDLHGYSQEEAQLVLNEFIEYLQQRGNAGKIIHGSGLNARGFVSKLKVLVRRWLINHPEVLAYTEPSQNNDGSVLILVKRNRNQDV